MTQHSGVKPEPMPKAIACLICEECGETIIEVNLNTNYLAAVLFKARKEHAKQDHGWTENTHGCRA